jgi:uncharacterized protein (TIGR03083 family)
MMDTQTTPVSTIPVLTRDEAMDLAATEYARTIAALRALTPEEWTRPTECPNWDVREMASHMLGFAEAHASLRELAHQLLSARKGGGDFLDTWTATQVRDRSTVPPAEIVRRFEVAAPASVKARRRMPGFIRSRHMKAEMPSATERWEIAFLMDTVFTRDTWMHRRHRPGHGPRARPDVRSRRSHRCRRGRRLGAPARKAVPPGARGPSGR